MEKAPNKTFRPEFPRIILRDSNPSDIRLCQLRLFRLVRVPMDFSSARSTLYPSPKTTENARLLASFHWITALANCHRDFIAAAYQISHNMPGRQYPESISVSHECARPEQVFMQLLRIPVSPIHRPADEYSPSI